MTNFLLYAATVLIWGSSWLAIKYQLGVVAPEVSLVYRFAIAAAVMLAFCALGRRHMRFTPGAHAMMALQGLFLFSTNYFLIYLGTQYLASGLVAVAFSTVVVMNIFGGALLLKAPIRPRVVLGAVLGLAGIAMVFWPEFETFDPGQDGGLGLGLVLAGTLSASLGMLTSARNQKRRLPVIETNAFGMAYGVMFLWLFTLIRGSEYTFDPSFLYVGSLVFLAVPASVVAFWTYLTLLGRIGPDRAGYASVLFPIIALGLSTLFEGFEWTSAAISGMVLVLLGNVLALTGSAVIKGRSPRT